MEKIFFGISDFNTNYNDVETGNSHSDWDE